MCALLLPRGCGHKQTSEERGREPETSSWKGKKRPNGNSSQGVGLVP